MLNKIIKNMLIISLCVISLFNGQICNAYASDSVRILKVGGEKFSIPASWTRKETVRTYTTGTVPDTITTYEYNGDYITFTELPTDWEFKKDDIEILEAYFRLFSKQFIESVNGDRDNDIYLTENAYSIYTYTHDKQSMIGYTIGHISPEKPYFKGNGKNIKIHGKSAVLYTFPGNWLIFLNGKNNIVAINIEQLTDDQNKLKNIFENIDKRSNSHNIIDGRAKIYDASTLQDKADQATDTWTTSTQLRKKLKKYIGQNVRFKVEDKECEAPYVEKKGKREIIYKKYWITAYDINDDRSRITIQTDKKTFNKMKIGKVYIKKINNIKIGKKNNEREIVFQCQ